MCKKSIDSWCQDTSMCMKNTVKYPGQRDNIYTFTKLKVKATTTKVRYATVTQAQELLFINIGYTDGNCLTLIRMNMSMQYIKQTGLHNVTP